MIKPLEPYFDNLWDNKFQIPYEPGHISEWYGQGYTPLFEMFDGKRRAVFTVNGEWDFRIYSNEDNNELIRCTSPDEITSELEEVIKNTNDGDTIIYDNQECTIRWDYNNWFEIFIDEWDKESDCFNNMDFIADDNNAVGPTEEAIKEELKEILENSYEQI